MAAMQRWCVTDPSVQTMKLEWKINDFTTLCVPNTSLQSSVFTFQDYQWILKITCRVDSHFSLELKCHYSRKYPLSATVKLSIVKDSKQVYSAPVTSPLIVSKVNWSHTFPINVNSVKSNLNDNQLTLNCEIVARSNELTYHRGSDSIVVQDCDLKKDFASMLHNSILSDVTLKAGTEEFKAHKALLSARSPVFARMFDSEMKEKETNTVEIEDIEAQTLQELLNYIYTGKSCTLQPESKTDSALASNEGASTTHMDTASAATTVEDPKGKQIVKANSDKAVKALYYAANKYQLDRLKSMCEATLNQSLTTENAAEMLLFADVNDAQHLKTLCIRFISRHPDVSTTEGWINICKTNNPVIETMQALISPEQGCSLTYEPPPNKKARLS